MSNDNSNNISWTNFHPMFLAAAQTTTAANPPEPLDQHHLFEGQQELNDPPIGMSSREQIFFHIGHVLNILDGFDVENDEGISEQEKETIRALQSNPAADRQLQWGCQERS
mmetsp:Transcript_2201/g.3056  ORF Transcript_2201/g.3056 Transcript_2201/m.3056 type:complete len:111 (+) Transcript_2201:112-444(+)